MDADLLKMMVKYAISPLVTCLVLFFIAIACHLHKRYCKWTYPIAGIALLWALLSSQFTFSNWLLHNIEYAYPPVKSSDKQWQHAQYIFVPGCYFYAKDLPEVSNWPACSLQRMVQASLMASQHPRPIIVSGGRFLHDRSVVYAEKAKGFVAQITNAPVIAIPKGHNTRQELEALLKFTGDVPIAVVTSATHMKRLLFIAESIGFHHLIAIPVEHLSPPEPEFELNVPSLTSMQNTERALYEFLGLISETL